MKHVAITYTIMISTHDEGESRRSHLLSTSQRAPSGGRPSRLVSPLQGSKLWEIFGKRGGGRLSLAVVSVSPLGGKRKQE